MTTPSSVQPNSSPSGRPVLDLSKATFQQVNACIAEHVAGLNKVGLRENLVGTMVYKHQTQRTPIRWIEIPDYLHDANAVLPLLEKHGHWKAQMFLPPDICRKGEVYRVSLAPFEKYIDADAQTFCRAAVFALLKASNKITLVETP